MYCTNIFCRRINVGNPEKIKRFSFRLFFMREEYVYGPGLGTVYTQLHFIRMRVCCVGGGRGQGRVWASYAPLDTWWRLEGGGGIHASIGKFLALESNPGVYNTHILVYNLLFPSPLEKLSHPPTGWSVYFLASSRHVQNQLRGQYNFNTVYAREVA
jgi:hypothetical protein